MISTFIAIQTFFSQLTQFIVSCIRAILLSKPNTKLPKNKTTESCIILGNGPSLKESIEKHSDFIGKHDLYAVNFFADSPLYHELKPRYYVILAPELWEENPSDRVKGMRNALFENIAKANWNMFFYIPHLTKKSSFWKPIFQQHKHIKLVYFNPTPIEGFKTTNFWFYNRNIGMPRPHNVLIPSILFSIAQGYKNIYLLGADHSWLPQIWVTPHNEVLLTQKHFYDEKTAQALPMQNYKQGKSRRLHEILHKFMLAFQSYFELRAYAEKKGVNILNATPDSYIDAFERYTIE